MGDERRYPDTFDGTPSPPRHWEPGTISGALLTAFFLAPILITVIGYAVGASWVAIVACLPWGVALPLLALALRAMGPTIVPMLRGAIMGILWLMERRTGRDFTGDHIIGQPAEPERIRLLPVRTQQPKLVLSGDDADGYTEADLRWLLERAWTVGHQTRNYLGQKLPSGRQLGSLEDFEQFYRQLEAAGLLVGRQPRHAGQLVGTLEDALRRFGL